MTTPNANSAAKAAPPAPRVGLLRAALSGWRVFLPAVGLNAGIQALLVSSDPVPLMSWHFGLLAAGSAVGVWLMVWLSSCAALAAIDGHPRTPGLLAHPAVAIWVVGVGVLAVAVTVLAWWAAPLALILGALVLPPAADGNRHPPAAAVRTVRRHPGRTAVFAIGVALLTVASWIVELLLGFFVTGPAASAATWLWLGGLAVLVLCWSCSLYRRGSGTPEPSGVAPA